MTSLGHERVRGDPGGVRRAETAAHEAQDAPERGPLGVRVQGGFVRVQHGLGRGRELI